MNQDEVGNQKSINYHLVLLVDDATSYNRPVLSVQPAERWGRFRFCLARQISNPRDIAIELATNLVVQPLRGLCNTYLKLYCVGW